LLSAKHETIIPAVKPLLDRLISEAGFWISDAVYQMIMDKAGEKGD
jgi:predicted nucleic acid-binding protein